MVWTQVHKELSLALLLNNIKEGKVHCLGNEEK